MTAKWLTITLALAMLAAVTGCRGFCEKNYPCEQRQACVPACPPCCCPSGGTSYAPPPAPVPVSSGEGRWNQPRGTCTCPCN
jgi:hypothetical protein